MAAALLLLHSWAAAARWRGADGEGRGGGGGGGGKEGGQGERGAGSNQMTPHSPAPPLPTLGPPAKDQLINPTVLPVALHGTAPHMHPTAPYRTALHCMAQHLPAPHSTSQHLTLCHRSWTNPLSGVGTFLHRISPYVSLIHLNMF
jgi:hypothetical protein